MAVTASGQQPMPEPQPTEDPEPVIVSNPSPSLSLPDVRRYAEDARFHRSVTLPAEALPARGAPFKVTYADYGYRNEEHPERESVLLRFAPLMGSRLLGIATDGLAREHGVRVVVPDCPGFGGTDNVLAAERLQVWREVVAALLRHLDIKHVAISCHSAGTVRALDFIRYHPEFLHPERPYIAIGSPWVLPAHSGVTTWAVIKALPNGLIAQSGNLLRLANGVLGPTMAVSAGFRQMFSGWVSRAPEPDPDTGDDDDDEHTRLEDALGPVLGDMLSTGDVQGISQECLVVLQNIPGASGWADWGDFDALAPQISELMASEGRRLAVDVFFAQDDYMIGDGGSKGPRWFESCFAGEGCGAIDFTSTVVPGSDHDMIWSLKFGAIREMYEKVAARGAGGSSC